MLNGPSGTVRAKSAWSIAAGILTGLALAASVAPAADLPEVKRRGELRVLVVSASGPDAFFPLAPGAEPGFDRELLDGFGQLHGVRLTVVSVSGWDRLVPSLLEGKADLIAGRFTVTEARRRLIDFTVEVFPTRPVVVTRAPHPPVTSLEQLRSERVGTVKGTSLAEEVVAAGVPAVQIDDSFSPASLPLVSLPRALREGRVSAVVMGVEAAIVAQRADPQLQLGLFLGPPGSLAYGLRREDARLRAALDDYIGNVRRTATWSRLVVKYFGESALEVLKTSRVP
jgi:ABC-type amino acid transport substrate-binding protein